MKRLSKTDISFFFCSRIKPKGSGRAVLSGAYRVLLPRAVQSLKLCPKGVQTVPYRGRNTGCLFLYTV